MRRNPHPGSFLNCILMTDYTVVLNSNPLYLFSAVYRISPSTPQEITSPIPTVSIIPKMISGRIHPPRILLMRHPRNTPGIAAGVNAGRMVSASEIRT